MKKSLKFLIAGILLAATIPVASAQDRTFFWVSHGSPADPVWTRLLQGANIETARHGSAAAAPRRIVGSGQAGDGIEQDDHIPAGLNHPLRPFDGEIGHPEMIGEIFVI